MGQPRRSQIPGLRPGRQGEEMGGMGLPQAEAATGTVMNAGHTSTFRELSLSEMDQMERLVGRLWVFYPLVTSEVLSATS